MPAANDKNISENKEGNKVVPFIAIPFPFQQLELSLTVFPVAMDECIGESNQGSKVVLSTHTFSL